MAKKNIKVLMVCLGNICRSPTAEIVLREKIRSARLEEYITVDSAGTGSWHVGHPPDERATRAALGRGYDMSSLRARQVLAEDLDNYDYVFAMDRQNLKDLLALGAPEHHEKVALFLDPDSCDFSEVPDPYYSGTDGFELVLDLIEKTSDNLVRHLAATHKLS